MSLTSHLRKQVIASPVWTSLALIALSYSASAAPLGPDPVVSFEGNIDYQANAETLLRCDQPVCDSGGLSGYACSALSDSALTMSEIPELSPDFRLVFADLSWAASEGAQSSLDTEVTLSAPSGEQFSVSASVDRSESFTDGLAMCQQLIPFVCAEAPANLSCDLQFYAHHADLTETLNSYSDGGGQLNGEWRISDVSMSGSSISDPQTAIAAVGSLTIGAWSLLLIYEAPDLPSKKIYYYQGLELNEGVNRQLFPSGFTAPPDPTVDLTLMVLEGDESISGDQLTLNGRQVADNCNPANNVFNSTVSINGECRRGVTGVDLDRFVVSGAIDAGDDEAELELVIPMGNGLTTAGEQLFTHWLVLSFDHLLPTFDQLKPEKFSTPPHESEVALGEVITYEIRLQNIGEGPATNVILTDSTPEHTSYITGSATVDQLPIDDGPQGSNPFAAGLNLNTLPQVGASVEVNEGHSIRFQVRVNDDAPDDEQINNEAQIGADLIEPISTNLVTHTVNAMSVASGGEEVAGQEMGGMLAGAELSGDEAGDRAGDEAGAEVAGSETSGDEVAGSETTSGENSGSETSGVMSQGEVSAGETPLDDFCGEGTRFNQESMLCESLCGAGLRWDATCDPGRCVQESQPPCQESEQSRTPDSGCQAQRSPSVIPIALLLVLFTPLWRAARRRELRDR